MIVKDKELHDAICLESLTDSKSVFLPLTDSEKGMFSDEIITHVFTKGQSVFREGEELRGILYLAHGKAKVFKQGIGGKEQIVRMAGAHSFIGYRAVFAGENTRASAVALEDTSMIELPFGIVQKLIYSNPEFSLALLKSFALDLRFAEERTVTLTQKHIRGRLAESLLLLKEQYGVDENKVLEVNMSREDVAKLSNMTPSNAIRTLSAFAEEGVIELEGRNIKIVNTKVLERISRLG